MQHITRISRPSYLRLAWLISMLLPVAAGYAQSRPAPDTATDLPNVVVHGESTRKSAISLDASALPAASTTLDLEQIERSQYQGHSSDLLRRVPGISSHSVGQGDVGSPFKMRGFQSRLHGADVAVHIDGVPQSMPSASVGNHGFVDLSWLTPDMIERIEVIKGPFSALHGDQNRAGAVNILTRRDAPSSVSMRLSRYGGREFNGVFSHHGGHLNSLLVANHNHIDGYRDNSGYTRRNLMGKLMLENSRARWALRGNFFESDWDAPGYFRLEDLRSGRFRPNQRVDTTLPLWGDGSRYALVLTRDPLESGQGLHTTVYLERFNKRRATADGANDLRVSIDERWIGGARALYNLQVDEDFAIAFGADVRRDDGQARSEQWPGGTGPSGNYATFYDIDLRSAGVYAQAQYRVAAALKLVAGLRGDRVDHNIINRQRPGASLRDYDASIFTPRFGLVWSVLSSLELYANTGKGFRSASVPELSQSAPLGPLGQPGGMPNAGLGMASVRADEVGFDWSPFVAWTLSGNYWRSKNQNEIARIADNTFAPIGDITREGWELDTRFQATHAFGGYASWGRIVTARVNNPLTPDLSRLSVPRDTVKLGADFTRHLGASGDVVRLNFDYYYLSGSPYFLGGLPTRSDSYRRYDARASLDHGAVSWSVYATWRPGDFPAEQVTNPTGASSVVDTLPGFEGGIGIRYRFSGGR